MKSTLIPFHSRFKDSKTGTALSIGNFDGVHLGHQRLLACLTHEAEQRSLIPSVMTFMPHPREFFALAQNRPELAPTRISTLRDKVYDLYHAGIQAIFLNHFGHSMATMRADEYIHRILIDHLRVRHLLVGEDFRFGYQRSGDFEMLQTYGKRLGFTVDSIPNVLDPHQQRYASTELRVALSFADLERVQLFLGHHYRVSGRVIHGKKLGRTLGFPTLNLKMMPRSAIRSGVYVVKVLGLGEKPLPGVASLGVRPTTDVHGQVLLEVHLIDTTIDAYGKLVCVEFLKHIRDEEKFPDLKTLTRTMHKDLASARDYFAYYGL